MHVEQHRNSITSAQLGRADKHGIEVLSIPTPQYAIHTKSARHVTPRYVMSRHTTQSQPVAATGEVHYHPPTQPASPGAALCVVRAASVAFDAMTREKRSVRKGRKKELESRREKKQRKKKEKNTKTRRHTVVQEMKQDRTIIMASRERRKGCPECKARGSFSRSKQIRDAKKNRSWRCCGGTEHGQRRQTFRRQDTQRQADRPRDGVISTMVGAVS
jgi:DNA-directed RNA polymerase subunit M/transcription elongation factor TFIIS